MDDDYKMADFDTAPREMQTELSSSQESAVDLAEDPPGSIDETATDGRRNDVETAASSTTTSTPAAAQSEDGEIAAIMDAETDVLDTATGNDVDFHVKDAIEPNSDDTENEMTSLQDTNTSDSNSASKEKIKSSDEGMTPLENVDSDLSECKAVSIIAPLTEIINKEKSIKLSQDRLTISESTKADGSAVVITENSQHPLAESASSPIVIDDESDDETALEKSAKKCVKNSSPRKTRLECSFIDGSFCCVTCDYKTPSNISFASHVVIHLHRAGENGVRLCNSCRCDKIVDVVKNCPLVRNMMKLLVEQKNKWQQEQEYKEHKSGGATAITNDNKNGGNGNMLQSDKMPSKDDGHISNAIAINRNITEIAQKSSDDVTGTSSSESNKSKTLNGKSDVQPTTVCEGKDSPLSKPKSTLQSGPKKSSGKKAVKIIYERGLFNCKTCDFVTGSELVFKKHLWKDLHKKSECNHCPSHIKDKLNNCVLLSEFMKHMYKNHKPNLNRASPVQSTKPDEKNSGDVHFSHSHLSAVEGDSFNISKEENTCKNKSDESTGKNSGASSESSSGKEVISTKNDNETNSTAENDISQTLAMLDGLNQAQKEDFSGDDSRKNAASEIKQKEETENAAFNIDGDADVKRNGVDNKDNEMMDIDEMECLPDKMLVEEESHTPVLSTQTEVVAPETPDVLPSSKGYICPVEGCKGWATQSQTQFKTHVEIKHSNIKSVFCAYCSQVFNDTERLIDHTDAEHMKFDRSNFLFRCSFDACEFSSNVVIDFRVHNIIKHKNEASFKCCHCSKSFDSTESLISHIQSNILNLAQCTICRCTSTNKNIITKHIRNIHPGEPRKINMEVYICCKPEVFTAHIPENTNNTGTVPPIILRRKETTYLCPCEFVAKDIYAFKEHINMCNMHRKKTIYVVPPVVKSIEAPTKEKPQDHEIHLSTKSNPEAENVEKKDDEAPPELNRIPDQVETSEGPISLQNTGNGADGTMPVLPEQENPESVIKQLPDNAELSDEQDVEDDEEPVDTELVGKDSGPEPVSIPEPEPRTSVYEQLGRIQEITCEKCNYVTCFQKFMESHMNVHESSKSSSMPFSCQQCPYSTLDEKAFVFHLNCHQGRKVLRIYQCKYCNLTSNQNDFIEDHLMDKHPEEDIRFECAPKKLTSVDCLHCSMKYATEKELLDHFQEEHGEASVKDYAEIVYGVIVECFLEEPKEREEMLTSSQALSIAPSNLSDMESRVISITPLPENEVNTSEGHLSCTYCSFVTHSIDRWKEHLMKHIGVGSLQLVMYCCRMCDWPSNDTKCVIDHCMKEHFMSADEARASGYESNYLEVNGKETEENSMNALSGNDETAWEMPTGVSIEKYHCDVCEFSTNEKATLSKHKLENHGTIEDDEDDSFTQSVKSSVDSVMFTNNCYGERYPSQIGSRDRYICSMCPYTTDKGKHWHCHKVTHEKQMTIVNGLKCGYCKTLSTKLNTMRYHHNRYHSNLPHKFYKVCNGAVLNELVVNPEDMTSIGLPYQVSSESPQKPGVLLKEILTGQRKSELKQPPVTASDGFMDEDSADSSIQDNSVIQEDESDSNEEYQEETHILTKSRPQEDPSKYCYKVPSKDLHQCIKCNFTHKYPSKVLRHFRYRHEKFCPYRCGYCNFISVESPKIRRHIHIMHKNMPVKILGTSSDSPYAETTEAFRAERAANLGVQEDLEYIIHKFIVKGEGNMQCCLICGYKQEGASSLKRHLFAIHLQYYPYKCKYCDCTAIERNKIIKHLERNHPSLEMRLVKLKFKGPLPEIPDHLKGMVSSEFVSGTDDSQTGESDIYDHVDNQAAGLGLKITNVASVPSRYGSLFNRGNITSTNISLSNEGGHPLVTVKEEPISNDSDYGMMPSNVSIPDDEDDDFDDQGDDNGSLPEHLGGRMLIKTELGSGLIVPKSNLQKSSSGGVGDAVHKMCMYCNYTTRWNIGDVKTHILVTHLKRYPYGCKLCGFTGRDKKKLKMHCRSQHPQAPQGTGFKYLYNEYANILVVKKIGKEMYIGVKGLDSIEAVDKASKMSMQELRALAGSDDDADFSHDYEHPVPPIQTPVYPKPTSNDSADAIIKKHQIQLQNQLRNISSRNVNEPLDLSLGAGSAMSAARDVPKLFMEDQHPPKPSQMPKQLDESHQQAEFTNKHLQCRKCGYVHFDMYKLKVHILGRHLKQKPYSCSLCGFDDFASHKVSTHVSEEHRNMNAVMVKNIVQRDSEIKKYVGHVDTSKKLVRPYMRTVEMDPNMPKPFECAYCNYQAGSRAKVRYHSIRKHKHMEVKVVEKGQLSSVPVSSPKSPTSTYTPMAANLGERSSLVQQQFTMLNPSVSIEADQNITCSKCLQQFACEDDLEAHEARVHSVIGVYQCVYCPSRQRHQYKMKQHQRLKHPKNPIKMVLIHVDEAQHRKKSNHIIPVRPPKPYGMQSAPRMSLPNKIFTGVYQCNHCPSRISYKAKMNWHQRVKHPLLPASYDFIPNEMSDKAKAMAAKRAKIVVPDWRSKLGKIGQKPQQEDMYRCKACNFATKDQFCMRNHAQAHTGYRPYKCPYCSYGNVKSFPVKMHVRKHHPNMPVKHKVERDHLREAELRQIYSSPMRKNKHSLDSSKCGPSAKKRVIEFNASGFQAIDAVAPKEEPASDGYDDQKSKASSSNASAVELNVKPYCCILCGHWSTNHTGIKRHLMWEIKYKPYACPHCSYRDVHASGIEVHCSKMHKDVPVESLYRRDPDREAQIQNLIEQSRKKQAPRNVSVSSSSSKEGTGRMSINTLKIIKRHGSKPTVLHKCKECGFLTTKPKHMASHVVRHGPKRHQCGYCEFQAFYPYEIQQHSTKFHPSLPIMSTLLTKKKPGQELIEVIKMTGPEVEHLLNGEIPNTTTNGTVEISLKTPVKSPNVGTPLVIPQLKSPRTLAPSQAKTPLKKQALASPTLTSVSPMLDGIRMPEYEFQLNAHGNYQCRYCDYHHESLQHFKNHLIKHMPPRWKCFYCKCMTQLSYDLRKHIKNFHAGQEIKIVKLDPNLHPPDSFKPSRTGILFTINLRDWQELIQGTAPPGRKDTDTVVVTEEEYTNMFGNNTIPIKQEAADDYEDGGSDLRSLRSEESDGANSSLCLNCCYCPFSTRDTAVYAAHLQTHTAKSNTASALQAIDDKDFVEAEEPAVVMARAQEHPPVVRITDIMELDPIALEGLLHGNGVTSIRF